jgi:hypothetical protein
MTTALVAATQAPIQLYAQSISPQECAKHRAWIGVRVEALLDGYWQSRPGDLVKAEILADWMDALQNFTPDEIRRACRDYLSGPDCQRKPKPGDIRALVIKARQAVVASLPKQPEPEPNRSQRADPAKIADIVGSFVRQVQE